MGEELIPNLTTYRDSALTESIMDYCTRGLLIPGEFIETYTRHPNIDAFYVHTKNGLRFSISGPEVAEWEFRRGIHKVCSPGSDEVLGDD